MQRLRKGDTSEGRIGATPLSLASDKTKGEERRCEEGRTGVSKIHMSRGDAKKRKKDSIILGPVWRHQSLYPLPPLKAPGPSYIENPLYDLMRWAQPNALIRYHELTSGGALVATLKWPNMYGSLAIGECSAGRYTFKRAGFLRPYVTARVEGTEMEKAILRLGFRLSGSIEFQDGVRFSFKRPSYLRSKWCFTSESGSPVMSITKRGGGKPRGDLTKQGDMAWDSYPHILALVAWYAIILDYEEGEAAVGALNA